MIEKGFRAAKGVAEANLARAEEAGDAEGVEAARRQLRLVAMLDEHRQTLQAELDVSDITEYESPLPRIMDELESMYQQDPNFFGTRPPLPEDALTDIGAFAAVVGWETTITNILKRKGVNSPVALYAMNMLEVTTLQGFGETRTKAVVQALGNFYPQFREGFLQSPPQQG